ncbi:hypothetical protein BRW65_26690 [Mycobacterium paraffinicum]|uniref:PknH-like extracellular domain-containing protein n=1 Tax=Mycobacterium paraffinicum TaxID=53378 RepID=A0A1Q4HGZ3_9MYCO|nr:sensor domain-containing protein [Mycobacterium paraffinicum]OJZ66808.1 hypothetical protein BRW65_26690 [Mycobacterium paraffinicum]
MSASRPPAKTPENSAPKHSIRTSRLTATGRWAILAATALCLLLTGCTATTTGRPAAAADLGRWQPPAILPQHLPDLLLSENDINSAAHTTGMAVRTPITHMWHDEDTISNPACLDTYFPAEANAYQGTNWTAMQGQILDDATTPGSARHALVQALISFRDADSAQQFFSQAKTRWSGCANHSLTVVLHSHAPVTWNFGELRATDTTLTNTQTQASGEGFTCQRALGLANNVIVDTLWCGFDTTSQASDIVAKTTGAISQA